MIRPTLATLFATIPTLSMADVPRVVTDIAPVHSLVAQVMGDLGKPELLLPANVSPHSFALRPSQAAALEQADAVFWMGEALTPPLEPMLKKLASTAANVAFLDLAQTQTHEFRDHDAAIEDAHDEHEEEHKHDAEHDHGEHEHEEEHKHDAEHDHGEHEAEHDHGGHEGHAHDHEGTDPHAWLNPDNALAWLPVIVAELSALDPENAATYTANAEAAQAELEATINDITEILTPVKGKAFVVFHDAYRYFEDRFDVGSKASISISDASAPGPARVERIQTLVRDLKVSCAFSEPQFSAGLVDTVLEGTDANAAILDPMGVNQTAGPDLYNNVLRDMAQAIAHC
ncbi:zinc ABC transporter substrate-binding protein [Litoreibacter albidus]|uniref:High-affinity zinc uptake system protein ZnuA n=1 Tax=Litoreibacter albidus TaxID=670155 RepID=A0A1H2Z2Y7_9RHOB|nr:zinc ABC transporter substrate-binding protein [Litoreibacter albidus]SDX11780.1 zinc transport system substrate-binding protein [Litoreibacter albidus]